MQRTKNSRIVPSIRGGVHQRGRVGKGHRSEGVSAAAGRSSAERRTPQGGGA